MQALSPHWINGPCETQQSQTQPGAMRVASGSGAHLTSQPASPLVFHTSSSLSKPLSTGNSFETCICGWICAPRVTPFSVHDQGQRDDRCSETTAERAIPGKLWFCFLHTRTIRNTGAAGAFHHAPRVKPGPCTHMCVHGYLLGPGGSHSTHAVPCRAGALWHVA